MLTTAGEALASSSGDRPWYQWVALVLVAMLLSSGFAYFRAWRRFTAATLGTALLFTVAVWFNAGTATTTWTVIYALWAALLLYFLIRQPHRRVLRDVEHPSLGRIQLLVREPVGPALPVGRALVVGVLAAALTAGALAGLRTIPQGQLEDADAAQRSGDCASAVGTYATAGSDIHEFTLSPAPDRARAGGNGCAATLRAEQAAKRGDHETAAEAYWAATRVFERRIGRTAPRLAELRLAYGDEMAADLRDETNYAPSQVGNYSAIIDAYRSIVTDTPGSPQAELVPARIDALYANAAADSATQPCAASSRISHLAQIEKEREPGAAPSSKAGENLAMVQYRCGKKQFDDKDYQAARTTLEEVTEKGASGPYAKKAANLLIDVNVADAAQGSAGALPPPAAKGTAPAGTTELVITNDSTESLEVLYSGPERGSSSVGACTGCTTRSPDTPLGNLFTGCSPAAETATIRLKPGTYTVVVKGAGGSKVRPYSGKWALKSGTSYSSCFYVSTSRY
ncbi:hypothetical protein [Streptomyces sp. NPDC050504]|uniref:hypothetical protein n=1 Tax=Streptomyces sp. NPDC050504 TaxID=3365618 RepID=UPI003795200D